MKRTVKKSIIVFFSIVAVIFQSCYTKKPIASYTSTPDYNKRVEVQGAQYIKKGNGFNVVVTIGLAGGGAAGGYFSNMVQRKTENGKEPFRAANVAIGAVVGLSVAYLIDQIAGKNKRFQVIDPNDWIKKANSQYRYLKGANGNFTIIHPSAEPNYIVRNIEDVRDFKLAFPNSMYAENMISSAKSSSGLSKNDLITLLSMYPNTNQSFSIKQEYLWRSSTVQECIDVATTYPELKEEAEKKALEFVVDISSAKKFISYFPKEKNEDVLVQNLIKKKINTEEIIALFPTNKDSVNLKYQVLSEITTLEGYCNFHKKYTDINKDSITAYIEKNKHIVKNFDDLQTLEECFGIINIDHLVSIVTNTQLKKNELYKVALLFQIPSISVVYNAKQEVAISGDFDAIAQSKSPNDWKKFIDFYQDVPDTKGKIAKAKELHEYYACLNSNSIVVLANYAKKHPEKYKEMENSAFNLTSSTNSSQCSDYLKYFPNGEHASIVQGVLLQINEFVKGFEMVYVERCTFKMGCIYDDGDCFDDEKPAHQVTLHGFYIGKYEVTQAQWKAVMGSNPSRFSGCENCPVENVSWDDIQEFIRKLNTMTGKRYRLPTEAEWELAAKGGCRGWGVYSGSNNVGEVAWYVKNSNVDNSGYKTHPVGQKKGNELGIYDMSGNVMEWCSDWYGIYSSSSQINPTGPYKGSLRVLRGGGWNSIAIFCRVAYRCEMRPSFRQYDMGFRLAYTY